MDKAYFIYLVIIPATTVILQILAANTAFAGFPRLSPHAGTGLQDLCRANSRIRGSRLVYSYGIISLAAMSSILIIVFQASVTRLIPLYAIGVFLSFTLAQAGMARRWWRAGKMLPPDPTTDDKQEARHELRYEKGWFIKMLSNGFGALCTAVVLLRSGNSISVMVPGLY